MRATMLAWVCDAPLAVKRGDLTGAVPLLQGGLTAGTAAAFGGGGGACGAAPGLKVGL